MNIVVYWYDNDDMMVGMQDSALQFALVLSFLVVLAWVVNH